MTYYVMVPNDASDAAGRETMELVSAAGSKCSVAEVTDDSYPQRKPRDQWEHDDSVNTSLLPAADEVASGSPVPASVRKAAQWLAPITHVAAFPKGAVPWPIADPGAPYNNSDIRTRGWPNRGLFLGGCTDDICVMHFQVGGIVSPYCIIVMRRHDPNWETIWYAGLPRKLASFEEMRGVLEGGSPIKLSEMSWCNEAWQTHQ